MNALLERDRTEPLVSRRIEKAIRLLVILVFFWVLALLLQYVGNAYGSDLNVESDDPAHYVTGLMVHDYFVHGCPWPPKAFAENFYAHYPKVAIGHWPPVFYVLQAVWMLGFGDSIHADLVLMALLNAAFATALFWVAEREFHSIWVGLVTALLLPLIYVVQLFSGTIMSDLPVALISFGAVIAWADFLEKGRTRSIVLFAVLASLSILTKGNGYALALLPPVTMLLARNVKVLRDWRLWAAGLLVAACTIPWTWFTRDLIRSTMEYQLTPSFVVHAIWFYISKLFEESSFGVSLCAVVGLGAVVRSIAKRQASPLWVSLIAWVLAFLLFHSLVPAGLEDRYLLMILPVWLLLMTKGASIVIRWIRAPRIAIEWRAVAAAVIVGVLFAATSFSIPKRKASIYSDLGKTIAISQEYSRHVILVASEGDGEGEFISQLAQWDTPRPRHVVLRASRLLASSDWLGRNYHLRFSSSDDLAAELKSIPVGLLVMDRTSHRDPSPHYTELEQMLHNAPEDWKLAGVYPAGASPAAGVALYVWTGRDAIPHKPFMVDVDGTIRLSVPVGP
ncbi:MAG TPA: glycosyltransferase family 39 protein [Bryobacteraceae bacterium]|nr:glycosyltransferase family 39 protein [Bryobacteraceae bacterium]